MSASEATLVAELPLVRLVQLAIDRPSLGAHLATLMLHAASLNLQARRPPRPDVPGVRYSRSAQSPSSNGLSGRLRNTVAKESGPVKEP